MGDSLSELEAQVRSALSAGDLEACATLVLRGYGPEILGYLLSRLRDEGLATEVFATFAEDLWRSLPTLSIDVSMRAYAYAVARNAAHRLLDRQVRKDRKQVPLSQAHVWSRVAEQVRTATLPHLKTAVKAQVAELRAKLSEDEQTLLTLRVDRGLSFQEIAVVYADGRALDAEALKRESARLRKRFETTKGRLRKLARDAGMLEGEERE